jgi:dTDP-4-dehydrorhamnose reductase
VRIFITGGGGLLGSRLARKALIEGHDVFSGYNHGIPENGIPIGLDLEVENSINKAIDQIQPEIIFHTASLTNVDRCEMERDLAFRINARGTKVLSEAAKKSGAFLAYLPGIYINGLCLRWPDRNVQRR